MIIVGWPKGSRSLGLSQTVFSAIFAAAFHAWLHATTPLTRSRKSSVCKKPSLDLFGIVRLGVRKAHPFRQMPLEPRPARRATEALIDRKGHHRSAIPTSDDSSGQAVAESTPDR
jgi:hypothetical protein